MKPTGEGRGQDNTHGDYPCRFKLIGSGELECAFGDYSVVYFFERRPGGGGGDGLRKVEVGRVMSWFDYRARAEAEGGRLPTTAELRAASVDVGYDQWTPITACANDQQTGRVDGVRANGENLSLYELQVSTDSTTLLQLVRLLRYKFNK